jgi:hypothetical protein
MQEIKILHRPLELTPPRSSWYFPLCGITEGRCVGARTVEDALFPIMPFLALSIRNPEATWLWA